ncbi:MAG: DUF1850 domain-containing protein [Caldimonas sp.]
MSRGQHAAVLAGVLVASGSAAACELVLTEFRSGRELARLPLDSRSPAARIAFTHSVLGTPVADHYIWRHDAGAWRAHLVEEHYEGEGYGLPNAAAPGETLVRDGAGWRLSLDRVVDPLVVVPLSAQRMRVATDGNGTVLLASLTRASVALGVSGCAVD